MKTILKLVIAALLLNAAFRGGSAMWKYYQFKDAAQQLVTFGLNTDPAQLHDQVAAKAEALDVPVAADDITIRREGPRTWADAKYTEPVEFLPRYKYPVEFSFSVEGFNAVDAAR